MKINFVSFFQKQNNFYEYLFIFLLFSRGSLVCNVIDGAEIKRK